MSQPLKQSTKNIPRGTTVIIIDEFGDLGAPRKKHRYFGYAVSKTKNPIKFAGITIGNRKKHTNREFKAHDDDAEGRKKILTDVRKERVVTNAYYVDKTRPPRGWKKGDNQSDNMLLLITKVLDDSVPPTGNVKVIVDNHNAYRKEVTKHINKMSTDKRTVTGDEYNSKSGPYSDLLQTHDYVAYAAGNYLEYDDPSLSDILNMKFRKYQGGDLK